MEVPKEDLKTYLAPYAWHHGDLSWKLDALQEKIRKAVNDRPDAKKILILSSRQIGKSFLSSCLAIEFLLQNPTKIARIVAPTLDQCQDIVQDNLVPICLDAPPGMINRKKTDYRWDMQNGSSLRLGGLKRAHVDSNRGGNASLVIYEECGFVDSDDFTYGVDSVLGPQLLRSNGREIFVTSPSEDPDHPIHTTIYAECEALGTLFVFTVFDSPSITPPQILEAMRRSKCALSEEFIELVMDERVNSSNVHAIAQQTATFLSDSFRREYLAEVIRSKTLMVVPAYNPANHVKVFRVPDWCHWTVSIDWGGVRDLTVALLHTYDYMNDMDIIWEEKVWPANTSTDQIIGPLKEWNEQYHVKEVWADVPGQVQVDLIAADYQVTLPQKADWKASVNNMAAVFSTDRIVINPGCKFLQKSLRAGMFNKQKTDFLRSTELGHCDALAALMYALRSQTRENPYAPKERNHDNVFFNQDVEEPMDLGMALNPKRFGRYK